MVKGALREIDEFAVREAEALEEADETHFDLLIEPFPQDFQETYYF